MKDETKEWVNMTQDDLAAAQILFERDLRGPTVFHCHLAVEKILKAHWIEQNQAGQPPRTHDLIELLKGTNLDIPQWHEFLGILSDQAVVSRYSRPGSYPRELVSEYLEGAKQLCELLQQQLN